MTASPPFAAFGLALALIPVAATWAQPAQLETVVVTAAPMEEALTVVTDARAPRQPVPAQDGADILKTIPGFSVVRKGGSGGDPVLRGMAGSRLNILLDGEQILGGCGNRMDPPTAYVFPESFERITLRKGPQSVSHGPGNSAGSILFERKPPRWTEPGSRGEGGITFGSFARQDGFAEVQAGTTHADLRLNALQSRSDDYRDGDGQRVHSRYRRWSGSAVAGWNPDRDTRAELRLTASDGEAAYADRGMDGVIFRREGGSIRITRQRLAPQLARVELLAYRNYVDHVMDNHSLRPLTGQKMASNPDRLTLGARLSATLLPGAATELLVGVDHQHNEHSFRGGAGYALRPREADGAFTQTGVFAEATHFLGEQARLAAGWRADYWQAEDQRRYAVTAGTERDDLLGSGFLRYEHDFVPAQTAYLGLGRSQRFPDYWETLAQGRQGSDSSSAFNTRPETTVQLDAGLIGRFAGGNWSLSVYAAQIDDFILIDRTVDGRMGAEVVRNITARTRGAELTAAWQLDPRWQVDAALALAHGENRSDALPLAQIPPAELRLGSQYRAGDWTWATLLRAVRAQTRYATGQGSIAGLDSGASSSFAVFSVNAAWRFGRQGRLAFGIDNLFDRSHAEYLSRSASDGMAGIAGTRINEPGRTAWVKLGLNTD